MHVALRWLLHPYVAGILSMASALLSSWMLKTVPFGVAGHGLVALMPVPFFVLFIAAELLWIRKVDEFHRRVMLDSLAIAFPAALLLGIIVEGLQKAGLLPGWTVGDVWPLMGLLWVPALIIARARYR